MAGYMSEGNLRSIAAFSPEEQANIDAYERKPHVLAELDKELARPGLTPDMRAVLLQYQTTMGLPPGAPAAASAAKAAAANSGPASPLSAYLDSLEEGGATPKQGGSAAGGSLSAYLDMLEAEDVPQPEAPAKSGGLRRTLGDWSTAFAGGAVDATKSLTDVAGADNAASKQLEGASKSVATLMSPEAQAEIAARRKTMEVAEQSGSTLEEIKAYAGGFAEAPVRSTFQAAGSILPTLATVFIPGAGFARAAALLMGTAQGAGAVKGTIYQTVRDEALKAGQSQVDAEATAAEAQSYAENPEQIALGAGLGAVAGTTGAEQALRGLTRGVVQQGAGGAARRVASGAAIEAVPEGLQGAQEKFAGNVAAQDAGFAVPTMRGVAGTGVLEGISGGAVGGVLSVRKPKLVERGPMSRAANAGIDAGATTLEPPAPAPEVTPEQAAELLALANKRRDALDAKAKGAKEQKTKDDAGNEVIVPAVQAQYLTPEEQAEREALDQIGGDAQALAQTYGVPDVAPEAELEPAPAQAPPVSAYEQREADRPSAPTGEPMEGDILSRAGTPFVSKVVASRALKMAGPGYELAPVTGGLVVRPIQGIDDAQPDAAGQPADLADGPAAGAGADAAGDPGAVGLLAADASGREPAGAGVPARSDGPADALGDGSGEPDAALTGSEKIAAEIPGAAPTEAPASESLVGEKIPSAEAAEGATDRNPIAPAPAAEPEPDRNPIAVPDAQEPIAAAPAELPGDALRSVVPDTKTPVAAASDAPSATQATIDGPATARTVTVNEKTVNLSPEQATEWDKVEADFKTKFDANKARFEREQKAWSNRTEAGDPDVGAKTPKERFQSGQKRLGMQLSAERRRIAGALTTKEQKAADTTAAAMRAGDTVQTPAGAGTVIGMAFGKVRVKVGDRTSAFPRNTVTKTEPAANDPNQQAGTPGEAPPAQAPTAAGSDAPTGAAVDPAAGGATAVKAAGLKGQRPIRSVIEAARTRKGGGNTAFAVYRAVDDTEASAISAAVGLDVRGYQHGVDEAAVKHIINKHGDEATEAARGNVAVTDADIEALARFTDPAQVNLIKPGEESPRGVQRIEYHTRVNGYTVVVEEARTGRKRLALVTMYKVRAAQRAPGEQTARYTSETYGPRPSTGASVEDEAPAGIPGAAPREEELGVQPTAGQGSLAGDQPAAEPPANDTNVPMSIAEDPAELQRLANSFSAIGESPSSEEAPPRSANAVRAAVRQLTTGWANAPKVVIVNSMDDAAVPQKVRDSDERQRSQGADGSPEGFFFGGKAYLIASKLSTPADVQRVLFHEVLGHYGLRGTFGDKLAPILDQIAAARPADIAAKVKQYGLDQTNAAHRRYAAEEVLAELAQTSPEIGFVRRAVAAIRSWLREAGINVPMTDAEIIRDLILPARRFVEGQGKQQPSEEVEAAFARPSANAAPQWRSPEQSRIDAIVYQLQNKQIDLKRVTAAIKESGVALNDRKDAYMREELYHGRVADRTQRYMETELRPLLVEMRTAGVSMADFEQYLHARHAKERNAAMAARNPTMPNNAALSGMSDEAAAKILAAAPPTMLRLAGRVDAMIDGTRTLMESSGIETADTLNALRGAYANYVPLYREDAQADRGPAIGQGFSVKGSVAKRATGSNAGVVNILAHIAMEREAVITRAEKNLVALATYALAKQNPNPDFWEVDEAPKQRVVDERTGLVVERADPTIKSKDHVLVAKLNGEDRIVVFNQDNERAVRMAAALKNLDADVGNEALRIIGKGTRWIASVNTAYNPVFAVVNAIRDVQGALINLTDTPIAGKQAQVLAGFMPALRGVWRANRDPQAAGEWEKVYREFAASGGQTGYRELFRDADDRAKKLIAEMKRSDRGMPARAALAALDVLNVGNVAIENAIRLSAYKAARDQGLTKDRAASTAKNLTVNFNRRGAAAPTAGSLYAFFNAAMQGNARLYQVLTGPKGKAIIAGGLAVGVLQALMLDGLDDDEEDAIPEWIKSRSLIVPIGDGKTLQIPMPLGLHVLPNIGRHVAELALAIGNGDRADASERLLTLTATLMDSFNPVGGSDSFLQMLLPTVVDPIAQLVQNRDFSGSPIYRARNEFGGDAKPGESMGKETTNPAYKVAAAAVNRASGGDEFARNTALPPAFSPQPEALRFLVETVGGGVWRETEKLIEAGIGAATGKPQETQRLPLVGRFYGDLTTDRAPMEKFYDNLRHMDVLKARAKGLEKSEDPDAGARLRRLKLEFPEIAMLKSTAQVQKQVKALRDTRRELATDDPEESERLKKIEAEMAAHMRRFNAQMRIIVRRPAAAAAQ